MTNFDKMTETQWLDVLEELIENDDIISEPDDICFGLFLEHIEDRIIDELIRADEACE